MLKKEKLPVSFYVYTFLLVLWEVWHLTWVAHLFRMRPGDVGNTPEGWMCICGQLFWNSKTVKFQVKKMLRIQIRQWKTQSLWCFFKSPLSVSSDIPSSSSPPWFSSRIGAFLLQYWPSFCKAGATNQSRIGTSMMRSHNKGSARHRSPSSRSMTCVILGNTERESGGRC